MYDDPVAVEPGLRARKKERTRQLILEVAWRLFMERGFDAVSVAEIARVADVSEATVFNYFPAKEDLVFANLTSFEAEMLSAVRDRPPGWTVADAFGRYVVEPRGLLALADDAATATIAASARLIGSSRTLRARERELWDLYTAQLGELIAEERGLAPDDLEAWVIANALIGVQRALVDEVRRGVLSGEAGPTIARRVRARGRRSLASVAHGVEAEPLR